MLANAIKVIKRYICEIVDEIDRKKIFFTKASEERWNHYRGNMVY